MLATTVTVMGGVWRHIEDLAVQLRALDQAPTVALPTRATALHVRARDLNLQIADLRETVSWSDAVWHAHLHYTYDAFLAAATVARLAIGPTVLTEHLPRSPASDATLRPGPRRPFARQAKTAFKRVQYSCADAVIAVSPSSAAFLAERYHVSPHSITAVMNGFDAPYPWQEPAVATCPVDVVCVGSVIHQKGHELLLQAAARSNGSWRAEVIGDGPLREGLSACARDQQLPVAFAGWRDDVPQRLAAAHVACLPSRWESCPYVALEAMGCGLPVVGSDVDGLRDLIEHDVTGLLVPADDPDALAAALDRLAAEPETRARMGAAGRERAAEHGVRRMVDETVAVYERVPRRGARLPHRGAAIRSYSSR